MDNLPSGFHKSFTNKFLELFKLYIEVKEIVLLAEYENKQQKFIISSVNELRNSLDHIMRTLGDPETLDKNFDKAKGHLYRAGYDAYEIIVISKLAEIKEVKEQFRFEAITTAYPDYFSKVVPTTSRAKKLLVAARANKKIDNGIKAETEEKHFIAFESIATELIKLVDEIVLQVDGIREVHQNIIDKENKKKDKELRILQDQKRKNRRNNLLIGIIAPLIIAIIVGIIHLSIEYKFFIPKESESKNLPKTEQKTP
jgi:hypothetical protein